MKPSVFVTRLIPDQGLEILRQHCEVEVNPENRVLGKEELIRGIRGKDALLCLLTDTVDAEVIQADPGLKVIANYAVGYNNIDVEAATKLCIPVTNTPGVLTETTADLAWALLMAAARRVVEADQFLRAGKYTGWDPMLLLGVDVFGKTLGLIGCGRIGRAVARRAAGFKMKVVYHEENRLTVEEEKELGVEYLPLEELLRASDFISLHVPLLPSTHHLIGAREFQMMKKSAILINTSRGPVINEKDLVEALRGRKIAGAALDVFEHEPELAPGLQELDNVVVLPHIASASVETRTAMAVMAANNVVAALNKEMPPNIVNPEVMS